MADAVIVDAVRSPVGRGKPGGALSEIHPVELLAQVLTGLFERNPAVDPGAVDDVLIGCVSQAAEQAGCPGRFAWLAAGFPEHVPSATIDRRCGSSQQAAHFGAQAIIAGAYDIAVVGGIESMSRVPMGSARMGKDPHGPSVQQRYAPGLVAQGISAELIAARWKFDRETLDAYAARSHQRAAEAVDRGAFGNEIVPVRTPAGDAPIEADETIRPGTTVEALAKLRSSFHSAELAERYPQIGWHVTAGNSSQLSDGASAALIMSEAKANELGLEPLARFHSFAVVGDDPLMMLTGPIPATDRIVQRSGVGLDEIGHFEVNEAFASVALAWQHETGVDDARLNPLGGAIALGHPLGASGTRLMATMVHGLVTSGHRYGLQVMCEGGGMANATLIENLRTA
ncbi:thiolase family protein [Mycolicibacterium thermoresistibile]|uniref:Acetyl-CoA acetyltransferase n=2 Tax=Mycolicibacterium thermoresistibile TaxID=1797 RepID=G7CH57_MYCT3|nr:thiolase family protein [Mycolicibacterium thermoresistibile]EHI12167.1 Acetyl-CoA acetyltransferase [Mycolicibacterium thermoresistibile ATCC 19527]MCV7191118.1 thiolase family protein [Mycolicibacterium thermoresistibile]GAT15534.1 3-ketoacyl-CoA thiolase [Mycolicibacterium thermoresistibile]SNW16915.1 thiolase [Mycolicibacterium thermoresistibile]